MGLQGTNRFDGGEANNPDIVVMNKKEGKCLVITIARLFNTRISEEKLEKDQDLKREFKRIWKCKEALGALGIVSTSLRKRLQVLDMAKELELLQQLCFLGTASRRTLSYFRSSLVSTQATKGNTFVSAG